MQIKKNTSLILIILMALLLIVVVVKVFDKRIQKIERHGQERSPGKLVIIF